MSDAEIAADLGCSAGTVRSHLSRALASLRVHINHDAKIGEADERLAN
jgi:DNA-directed RNA polymerase specialized sigma24 family protein